MELFRFSVVTPRSTCCTCIRGCVYRRFNSNPKYGFTENFAPKNIGIMHISYSKILIKTFIERWVSVRNFQFDIVLYNFRQHLVDSKLFSFRPRGFMLSHFGHKFDGKELILRYCRTEPKKLAAAENFYPQKWEIYVPNCRQKMLSSEI